MIGRPITTRSAPSASACSGVATRAWSLRSAPAGRTPGVISVVDAPTAARTSANFYLVPGTAALLAWALLGERLSALAVAGLVVASAGCWLVNAGARVRRVAS